jgi:hypothetical protein
MTDLRTALEEARRGLLDLSTRNRLLSLPKPGTSRGVMIIDDEVRILVIEGLAGVNKSNVVFVYDNEPRNKDICRIMDKVIEMGYNVAFWPDHIEYKDINDMVIGGLKPADIKLIIDNNTYVDLQAKMKMVTWRKS